LDPASIARWKDAIGVIQSSLTSVGILVAGVWGLWLFVNQRQRNPHANVEHGVNDWPATPDMQVVRLTVRVTNVGNVMIRLNMIRAWVQQLVPAPPDIIAALNDACDPIAQNESEMQWPLIAQRECQWPRADQWREIEPGESDEFHFDFRVPSAVRRVAVYSYVRNIRRSREGGWNTTTVYALDERDTRAAPPKR
jgi:hypothetical protein